MEYFDLYDKDRRPLGTVMERGTPVPKNMYRLVVHICVFDGEARMLIQKRADCVENWPGRWDLTAGGSVIAGETSSQAAEREIREEIGLVLDLGNQLPLVTVYFSEGFDDIYAVFCKPDKSRLSLQEEEVCGVQWASEDAICAMIDNGAFIPYDKNLIHLLFSRSLSKLQAAEGRA